MTLHHLRQTCVERLLAQSRQLTFAQLSPADAQEISRAAQFQHWQDGSIISDFGDRLKKAPCYFIVEGSVSVHIPLPDGREPLVVHVETPGCIFGADALYLPTERYARYVAEGEVVCALFTTESIEQLAAQRPDLAYKLVVLIGAVVYRNFRINVKRLALDAALQISEKAQFEGELKAAHQRAKVALVINPDANNRP